MLCLFQGNPHSPEAPGYILRKRKRKYTNKVFICANTNTHITKVLPQMVKYKLKHMITL